MSAELRVFVSDTMKNWLFALADATGKNPSELAEKALVIYKAKLDEMGMDSLLLQPRRSHSAAPLAVVSRSTDEKIEETCKLIDSMESTMDFVGFGHCAGGPMVSRGIVGTKQDGISLLNMMVEKKIILTEKRKGLEEDSEVTAIVLNDDHELVQKLFPGSTDEVE